MPRHKELNVRLVHPIYEKFRQCAACLFVSLSVYSNKCPMCGQGSRKVDGQLKTLPPKALDLPRPDSLLV